jgi:hypothetical protein
MPLAGAAGTGQKLTSLRRKQSELFTDVFLREIKSPFAVLDLKADAQQLMLKLSNFIPGNGFLSRGLAGSAFRLDTVDKPCKAQNSKDHRA